MRKGFSEAETVFKLLLYRRGAARLVERRYGWHQRTACSKLPSNASSRAGVVRGELREVGRHWIMQSLLGHGKSSGFVKTNIHNI